MFVCASPDQVTAIVVSPLSDNSDSDEFILSQPLLFPDYVPSLDVVKRDLEDFIMEIEVLKERIQKTYELFVTYRNDTEEEGLSKQIFYDHIRHLQEAFISLLGYIKEGSRVRFTEVQRSDQDIIISLLGGAEAFDGESKAIARRFLELSLPRHSYTGTTSTEEQPPTINELLVMACKISAISRREARAYWDHQTSPHLENNSTNSVSWGPTLTAEEFEAMLNMP